MDNIFESIKLMFKPKNQMAKTKMKTCSVSGKQFAATTENFYVNSNSADGLHPYHKQIDNFRRANGVSISKVKSLVNLLNN